ncbi:MAG: hypothetical protein AAF414_02385 [Pseudomonadota bacterium]
MAIASLVWSIVTLGLFSGIIRLSYRIEARSKPKPTLPVFTNFLATALNIGVARDAGTQRMRRRMLALWAAIALAFIGFALWLAH